jgi:hypothetical protein
MRKKYVSALLAACMFTMLFSGSALAKSDSSDKFGRESYTSGNKSGDSRDRYDGKKHNDDKNRYDDKGSKDSDWGSHPNKGGKDDKGKDWDKDKDRDKEHDKDRDKDWDKDRDKDKDKGKAGTTLSVTKTAEGFWSKKTVYDWEIDKLSSIQRPVIGPNQSFIVDYAIDSERSLVSESEVIGVRGHIKVNNGGERATQSLKLVDQVEYKLPGGSKFIPVPGATVTIIPAEQLRPGETKAYPYEITFAPIPGATYRNTVQVTITNHSGSLGVEKGPNPKADFRLPSSPAEVIEDATATLTDQVACPTGFTCEVSDPGPWQLEGPKTVTYVMTPTNVSAASCQIVPLTNRALLTENTTGQVREASNTIEIFTGCCACQPPQ